jgi:hypothetical protein
VARFAAAHDYAADVLSACEIARQPPGNFRGDSSVRVDEKLSAFVELERAIHEFAVDLI